MATHTTTPTSPLPDEVVKVGNLVDAPTLAFAEGSGKAFTRLSLAVDNPVDGNWNKTEAVFYRVVCFDQLALNVAESVDKGDRVIVHGRPELETWTDKDGNTRTEKKILARSCGPDLRFATAKVTRVRKTAPALSVSGDEEPF
jgi:single-strand DNA-binding protein